MYTIDEAIEIVMDSDCNDLTVGDCYDEEEIITVINNLANSSVIGETDDSGDDCFDDGDVDVIIDNLN